MMVELTVGIAEVSVGSHGVRFEGGDESLAELADSIRRVGVINPIVVRREGSELVVVAGHRRLAGARMAGLHEIPVRIFDGNDVESSEVIFAENFHRADPSPVEVAAAIRHAVEDGGVTVESVAAGFRRSVAWVRDQMRIVEWPKDVLEALHARRLGVGAASHLARVEDDAYRMYLVEQGVENGLTERMAASWVQGWRSMVPADEAVELEADGAVGTTVAVTPQAPCGVCGDFRRPAELAYMGCCPSCMEFVQACRTQMRGGGGG